MDHYIAAAAAVGFDRRIAAAAVGKVASFEDALGWAVVAGCVGVGSVALDRYPRGFPRKIRADMDLTTRSIHFLSCYLAGTMSVEPSQCSRKMGRLSMCIRSFDAVTLWASVSFELFSVSVAVSHLHAHDLLIHR